MKRYLKNSVLKYYWIIEPAIVRLDSKTIKENKERQRKGISPKPYGTMIRMPKGITHETIVKWLKLLPKKEDLY